jgi:hypothetical protein
VERFSSFDPAVIGFSILGALGAFITEAYKLIFYGAHDIFAHEHFVSLSQNIGRNRISEAFRVVIKPSNHNVSMDRTTLSRLGGPKSLARYGFNAIYIVVDGHTQPHLLASTKLISQFSAS